jgi:hypothetical protein
MLLLQAFFRQGEAFVSTASNLFAAQRSPEIVRKFIAEIDTSFIR